MRDEQAGTLEETTDEKKNEEAKAPAGGNSAQVARVIPFFSDDVISLKITIDFELRPSGQRRVTTRSTEGGEPEQKEVERGERKPEGRVPRTP